MFTIVFQLYRLYQFLRVLLKTMPSLIRRLKIEQYYPRNLRSVCLTVTRLYGFQLRPCIYMRNDLLIILSGDPSAELTWIP